MAFLDPVNPPRFITEPMGSLRCINKTAWGAKFLPTVCLSLTYGLSYCSWFCHLLNVQLSCLCTTGWFIPPTLPPPLTTLPPPPPLMHNTHDIPGSVQKFLKNQQFQLAANFVQIMLATYKNGLFEVQIWHGYIIKHQ